MKYPAGESLFDGNMIEFYLFAKKEILHEALFFNDKAFNHEKDKLYLLIVIMNTCTCVKCHHIWSSRY